LISINDYFWFVIKKMMNTNLTYAMLIF